MLSFWFLRYFINVYFCFLMKHFFTRMFSELINYNFMSVIILCFNSQMIKLNLLTSLVEAIFRDVLFFVKSWAFYFFTWSTSCIKSVNNSSTPFHCSCYFLINLIQIVSSSEPKLIDNYKQLFINHKNISITTIGIT